MHAIMAFAIGLVIGVWGALLRSRHASLAAYRLGYQQARDDAKAIYGYGAAPSESEDT